MGNARSKKAEGVAATRGPAVAPRPANPPEKSWLAPVIGAVLFALTVLLFARAIGHDFVNYDDPDYVTTNAHVKAGLTASGIGWALRSGEASNWHPLTWMSHQLDATLFGLDPRGHHATSVLLHGLNAALAFFAVRRLTSALWASAFCAALFAWHPLRVESVAWVAERKDVLSGFFGFAALWAYAGYAKARGTEGAGAVAGAWRWYGLTLVTFALGLMAKPMLVTLPCVFLLLDVWPLRRLALGAAPATPRSETWRRLVGEKLPLFGLVAVSSVVTYLVQKGGGSVSVALDFPTRLANAVVAAVRYLGKFLIPVDLAVLYPHPGYWPTGKVVASTVIVVGLTLAAGWQLRRRPWIAVGWCWFLGMLVPVIGLVQVGLQSMADRYTYLPLLGVQLALGCTLREWLTTPAARKIGTGLAIAGLALLAARTWSQLGVWQNSFTLFDHAIAVTERNYLAHDNRGLFLFKAGKVDEALADYRRSLAINPAYLNANNNLGYALAQLGRPAEALPVFRAALAADPGHLEVRNNLANALSDLNQLPEAMEHYEYVLARQPEHVNALNGSAVALAMQNRLPEAKARLEKSLRLAPDTTSALNNLGNVCSMLGQVDDAIRHYRRATELAPNEPHPFVLIGTLLNQQQKFTEAVVSLQQALAINAINPEAHAQLGLAYVQTGRRDEAVRAWRTALQQQPNHAQAKLWLDALLGQK